MLRRERIDTMPKKRKNPDRLEILFSLESATPGKKEGSIFNIVSIHHDRIIGQFTWVGNLNQYVLSLKEEAHITLPGMIELLNLSRQLNL